MADFQKIFMNFGLKYPCYVSHVSEWDSTVFLLGEKFKIKHLVFFLATTVCQVKEIISKLTFSLKHIVHVQFLIETIWTM